MSESRIKISSIIQNQLPEYIKEEFPLVQEFLSQYFIALESQGNVLDLLQNLDQYVKIDLLTDLTDSTILTSDVNVFDSTINVESTSGFPNSYGLLKIGNEIITYKSKTSTSFNECVRGFVGIEEYYNNSDQLKFSDTAVESHTSNTTVSNLSILFLKEFFNKIKTQIAPGFEDRSLDSSVKERLFIKQVKDFYSSKGTVDSFEILFRALYGKDVEVLLPRDNIIHPSGSEYRINKNLVVEAIEGDPVDLKNLTLYQDEVYDIKQSTGTISNVEKIVRGGKDYYVISVDFGYDTLLDDTGLAFGEFSVHPSTKTVTNTLSGSDTITVDSTVGFPSSGDLKVRLPNNIELTITYTSKSLNQFYGCSGITSNIEKNSELNLDVYAYGYTNIEQTDIVKVKITGVLSDLKLDNPTKYYSKGDLIKIKTLGKTSNEIKANNWIFNVSTNHNVKSIEELDNVNFKYLITLYDPHLFHIGDSITVIPPQAQPFSEVNGVISLIKTNHSFVISTNERINSYSPYKIRKNIVNVNSENNLSLNKYTANIQNVYYGYGSDRSIYVASNSLPSYPNTPLNIDDKKIVFSGDFSGEELTIRNHNLYTGDVVVYNPESETNKLNLLSGKYFVKRISSDVIKLSRSRDNLFLNNYLSVSGSVTDNAFYLERFSYDDLTLKTTKPQKLIRNLSDPLTPSSLQQTPRGFTGIFVNGVELLNYKSNDFIYYGPIEEITVENSGSEYDVINPPTIEITDSIGTGASVYCNVSGTLSRIDVLDPGVNYIETPRITIIGGNGTGASAEANLTSYDYSVSFNSSESGGYVNLASDTIGFSTYHKLINGEEVIYQTNTQRAIGGITTNSSYFVSVVNSTTIQLHTNLKDSLNKTNPINIVSPYGEGIHTLKSRFKKSKLQSVTVTSSGSNYKNRRIKVTSSGISTANNSINYINHGFSDKDIIVYETTGTVVSGLSTTKNYYVSLIDENSFRLNEEYILDDKPKDFYYTTQQFVNLTSVGSGTHTFRDQPIQVLVDGTVGVTTFSNENFKASVQPIFKGSISSVYVEDGGSNYGSEEILNYDRQPEVTIKTGSGAELVPVVDGNGSISQVIILNSGSNYNSPPDLVIENSTGVGAILTPIVQNGILVEVRVIYGGVGYIQDSMRIRAVSSGSNGKLLPKIKSWNVNLVERTLISENITNDDGIIESALNRDYELQYSHAYAPRNLRRILSVPKYINDELIYVSDLILTGGREVLSDVHSPIIGWAYDGNPIYGPYGYSEKSGGPVKLMKSGYQISLKANRPSLDLYPEGFFVEDYEYTSDGDLDEHNGRFCFTPEYPKGTYAYFCTVNDIIDRSGIFLNYRRPVFPYVIGNHYKSTINDFNLSPLSNQDEININEGKWLRNTAPYYIANAESEYEFVLNPNDIKEQDSNVVSVKSGIVTSITVVNSDTTSYTVTNKISFDNSGTGGEGLSAYVDSVEGPPIVSVSSTTIVIDEVELLSYAGISTFVTDLRNGEILNIRGKYPNEFLTTQPVNFIGERVVLSAGINSTNSTGIVTYINVYSPRSIRPNDLLNLSEEVVKVLNVDVNSSRLRILRNQNNTQGITTIPAGYIAYESPTKFVFDSSLVSENVTYYDDVEIYFDPSESVGIGTTVGVGVGATLYFSNPGVGNTFVFVPTQSIYLPKHNIKTGTKLLYHTNDGSPIAISTDGISNYNLSDGSVVYAARISDDFIGISSIKVGLGSTGGFVGLGTTGVGGLLYFTGIGTGVYHSFKPNYDKVVIAEVSKNLVTVATDGEPNVIPGESINVEIVSNVSTAVTVFYDDYSRRICTNELAFISSDIDLETSSIYIQNHPFKTGQNVLYRQTTPIGGLVDNQIYYIINYGRNLIKLASSYYNTTINSFIEITSVGSGSVSAINPQINTIKNGPLVFDLSDSSLSYKNNSIFYPAFEFNIYKDPELTQKFEKTDNSNDFEVVRTGRIGVDTNASVTLLVNDDFPKKLYYRIEPKIDASLLDVKRELIFDDTSPNNGEILFVNSVLSGTVTISGVGTTSFNYNTIETPEAVHYTSENSNLSFEKYQFGTGKLKKIRIESRGLKYKSLPVVNRSYAGDLIYLDGDGIGEVNKTNIIDVGFSYPSDFSLRPTAKLPEILKVYPLSILDTISIGYEGFNYNVSPDLILIDRRTNEQLTESDISYEIGDTQVKINKNVSGIYDVTPLIVPINNSNGIGINTMYFDSASKYVTVYLNQSFSDADLFPFDIGSRVLIEGVGVSSVTAKGYNSENYNYALFTVISSDPNIGGANGSVTYSMENDLLDSEDPGIVLTNGFIVPESYFPSFEITLKKLPFYVGETVESNSSSGVVQEWDSRNNNLKVATNRDFVSGEVVRGKTSGSNAVINSIYNSDCTYEVSGFSTVRSGWTNEIGFLNNDTQRTHDNDYYQYFSYDLRSEVSISDWNNSITKLNHTAGFKKFGNLIISSDGGFIGLSTIQTESEFTGVADFYSTKNLHCFDDFDLVSENNITLNNKQYSDNIIFNTKVLQDYIESVGNRVLNIDDISSQFNSNPRPTKFSIIDSFDINAYRSKKYIIYITDRRYTSERESIIVTLVHDENTAYLNQYARVETKDDLGYFDFSISGSEANLLFYPNKSSVNNYNLEYVSFGIKDSVSGIGTQDLGNIVKIDSHTATISAGSTSATIVGIASTYRSAKVLVQIGATDKSYHEFNEITLLHDDQNVFIVDYGELTTGNFTTYSSTGIGTYHAYLSGSDLNLDFILNSTSSVGYNINSVVVSLANTSSVGVGSTAVGGTSLESNYVSIASSTSPVSHNIAQHEISYNTSYYIITVEDTTNNNYQISELVLTNTGTESYVTEYGIIESNGILGDFDSSISGTNVYLNFTPNANINCEVRLLKVHLGLDGAEGVLDFNNFAIDSSYGLYQGTDIDIKREFNLTHNLLPIFERQFNASETGIIDVNADTIYVPGHYFVTGEEIEYYYEGGAVGIATTTIAGIGTTDKLPSSLYIVKVDDLNVKVSASASDALLPIPNVLDITSVGIGSTHLFTSKNQNAKVLVSIDNVIQSPIVSTAITSTVATNVQVFDDSVAFTGITSFFGGDLIKIDDEIMRVTGVGVGSTNVVTVIRPWMGTGIATHATGSLITKVQGNYNIIDNIISFADAPYGNVPIGNPDKFDEIDYTGITTSSTFNGRVFLRSGVENSNQETYAKNYIFDDISNNFDGFSDEFRLTSSRNDITGISTSNSILLINSIFQLPSRPGVVNVVGGYDLSEGSGITSVTFVGTATTITSDVNLANLPRGGVIVSVGSSKGFGYQPLVSAGGTAIVSVAGTIQSISIGNSGSGYRNGYQVVNVGVGTSTLYTPNIEFIGTASISGGNIVSVAITNPGTGYTSTNPPYVFFDAPLSYSNIPLVYSSDSKLGVGTEAVVDIVVGQGSSVISFEFKNYGYGYVQEEILTVPIVGAIGIPTDSSASFEEFQISIETTYQDEFSGWTIGDLQVLDPIDALFDGQRIDFPIAINGNQTTIRSRVGSNIDVQSTLLVFINDILQVPGEGYQFKGGSVITFTEAPQEGDTSKLLFYKGTGDVDTVFVDVLETVKPGDKLQINSEELAFKQNQRLVTDIVSTDVVKTNNYTGPGISDDVNFLRPVTWCKQMTDLVINNQSVTKDRVQYEPYVYPTTNIIENVGTSSTVIYVESVKTFFDSHDEYLQDGTTEKPQKKIKIVSQDTLVSASATAIVSSGGTITSIVLSNPGIGYTNTDVPEIVVANPVGLGSTQRAIATATVSTAGTISNITINYSGVGYTFTNPPLVLISPPKPKVEVVESVSYSGDFGVIVGYGISTISGSDKNIFDFYIPENSFLRDTNIVGTAITLSQIQVGDFFVVNNSNVSSASTNFFTYRNDSSIIGISTRNVDGIYQVNTIEDVYKEVVGVGSTSVKRIYAIVEPTTGISTIGMGSSTIFFDSTYYTWDYLGITTYAGGTISTSNYFGEYSWGKISNYVRRNPQNFKSNGISGISTSPTIIRFNALKYEDYTN